MKDLSISSPELFENYGRDLCELINRLKTDSRFKKSSVSVGSIKEETHPTNTRMTAISIIFSTQGYSKTIHQWKFVNHRAKDWCCASSYFVLI